MRTSVLLGLLAFGLAPCVLADTNDTYQAGLVHVLQGLGGLTKFLADTVEAQRFPEGQALFSALPKGNHTFFVPNDDAINSLPPFTSSEMLGNIFSYHVVPGNVTTESATYPNVNVARTLMNDSSLVTLEGNKSQVLAWTYENGNVTFLNQAKNITIKSRATYENLELLVIDKAFTPPSNISTTLAANNLTGVQGVIGSVPGLSNVLANAHGYTLFAPNDAAIQAAQASLGAVKSNTTLLLTVLRNHVINGTSAYSPLLLGGTSYTTAAGEPLKVSTNSSGSYVTSGTSGASAKIVRSDLVVSNGVIHVIDAVLANLADNESAASAAYASATAAAAQSTTQTGPITAPTSSSAPSPSPSSGKKNGASRVGAPVALGAVAAALGVLAVFV